MTFKRYVFISYKSEEYKYAKEVKCFLEENGLCCWMAPESIPGGSDYATEITRAIRKCDIFVLILSEKCQQSDNVSAELGLAFDGKKLLLPIEIEECILEDNFMYYLRNVQRYEAYRNKEKALSKMLADINEKFPRSESEKERADIVFEEDLEPIREIRIPRRRSKNKFRRMAILGATLIFAMVVGILELNGHVTIAGTKIEKDAKGLYLDDVKFAEEDMEIIAGMQELRTVEFTNCSFPSTDLSAIFKHDLYVLKLENCNLTNEHLAEADFEKYTELAVLQLAQNPDLTSLGNVALAGDTIYSMDISYTGIQELDFLTVFENMEKFKAVGNEIKDISGISNCKKLKKVDLTGNSLLSLGALDSCSELISVSVGYNYLSNLQGLENAIWLKEIHAYDNALTTLEGLENATVLEEVFLANNQLTDLSVLEKSAGTIKNLDFRSNKVCDISFLKIAENLKTLSGGNNQIESLESLANCPYLENIFLPNNRLKSMEGLTNHGQLSQVDLSDNQITDADAVKYWGGSVYSLNLSNNRITSLEIPMNFRCTYIDLHGNELETMDFLQNCKGNEVAFDYQTTIDFSKLCQAEFREFLLLRCPKDKQVEITNLFEEGKIRFLESEEELEEIKGNRY